MPTPSWPRTTSTPWGSFWWSGVSTGGKGLGKAIRAVLGSWALVHRCPIHKLRNVDEHRPKHRRAWVRAAMRKAWAAATVKQARERLTHLAGQLENEHLGAAASIRKDPGETRTLIRFGVTHASYRTLCSKNPIANPIGNVKQPARNAKRWRGGKMALRWAVRGLTEAGKRFHRVRGCRRLGQLDAALDVCIEGKALDTKEKVAQKMGRRCWSVFQRNQEHPLPW